MVYGSLIVIVVSLFLSVGVVEVFALDQGLNEVLSRVMFVVHQIKWVVMAAAMMLIFVTDLVAIPIMVVHVVMVTLESVLISMLSVHVANLTSVEGVVVNLVHGLLHDKVPRLVRVLPIVMVIVIVVMIVMMVSVLIRPLIVLIVAVVRLIVKDALMLRHRVTPLVQLVREGVLSVLCLLLVHLMQVMLVRRLFN